MLKKFEDTEGFVENIWLSRSTIYFKIGLYKFLKNSSLSSHYLKATKSNSHRRRTVQMPLLTLLLSTYFPCFAVRLFLLPQDFFFCTEILFLAVRLFFSPWNILFWFETFYFSSRHVLSTSDFFFRCETFYFSVKPFIFSVRMFLLKLNISGQP